MSQAMFASAWRCGGRTLCLLILLSSLETVPSSAQTTLADVVSGCGGVPPGSTVAADPSTYQAALATLGPGDRLLLAAGTYPNGLSINGLNGAAGQCIVIEGPASGARAAFTARNCCNTVSIRDSSYVAIRNLELDGSTGIGDAVKAESDQTASHHILLENLYIHDHDADQQIVGINTKSVVWNWVIRRNVIESTGTGLYLGDSDGEKEFVGGLIEHNLIQSTLGYNMQVKHQNGRATGIGAPASATTLIRHNVFSKLSGSSSGSLARPNVLVGHWPLAGDGSTDVYQLYGNLFYGNPVEALFQGEGNVLFHDNLMVNGSAPGYPALAIQPHYDLPRYVEVFHNTVVAAGAGISVSGGDPSFEQKVRANAVFSPAPISAGTASHNVADGYGAASTYLVDPTSAIGAGLDLHPLTGALTGTAVDLSDVAGFLDAERDFDGTLRGGTVRGAYATGGGAGSWSLALERKPDVGLLPADLAITKTNDELVSIPGAVTTFVIEVLNLGPGDALSSTVTDPFDAAIYDVANVAWTCVPGGGSGAGTSCPGSGIGADLVNGVVVSVEAGGSLAFTVDAPVLVTASGLLTNTATAAPPGGASDPDLSNNEATDTDGVPGACGHAADLDLSGHVVDAVEGFTACGSIGAGAGFEVKATGDVSLTAGSLIVLRDGAAIRPGGRFAAVLDASLAVP